MSLKIYFSMNNSIIYFKISSINEYTIIFLYLKNVLYWNFLWGIIMCLSIHISILILVAILTTFRPLCSSAFFNCLLYLVTFGNFQWTPLFNPQEWNILILLSVWRGDKSYQLILLILFTLVSLFFPPLN